MKFNFNQHLKDLDGSDIIVDGNPMIVGKELAKHLSQDTHETSGINALDAWEFALKINKGEDIDLTTTMQEAFKKWVVGHKQMFAILKGQILQILDKKPSKTK